MKKQVSKITLKTDQIIALSKNQAQSVKGALPKSNAGRDTCFCPTDI
ncbi:class I lanthipeptide [Larkinella harenae]